MYEQGEGVEQDTRQATEWYFRAAMLGDQGARGRLKDLGVSPDSPVFTDVADVPEGVGELPALRFQESPRLAPEQARTDDHADARPPAESAESDDDCGGIIGMIGCM